MALIKQFLNEHQYDKKRRKYSNKHYFQDNTEFRKILSKEHVEINANGVRNRIKMYNKNYNLVNEDIEDLERAVARYEISVSKVIQCYDQDLFDFDYTLEELQNLIDLVFEFHEQVTRLATRKAFQD